MLFKLCLLFVILYAEYSQALYSESDDVVILTDTNWHDEVEKSDSVWFVEFYASWCGNCAKMVPQWKEFAKHVKGMVKVGVVDIDKQNSLLNKFPTKGVPSIRIFGDDKKSPAEYQGTRAACSFVTRALDEVRAVVEKRQGKSGSKDSSGDNSGNKRSGSVELTDSNFKSKVADSDEMWLVGFFAPWCGHCKQMKPDWESAATELSGKINLGSVDATVHEGLSRNYGVRGYPTIKFFPAGRNSEPIDYDGGRSKEDIINWAQDKIQQTLPPPEVMEVTSKDVVTKNCENKQLCIMVVLPVLLDCQSKCRNNYIEIMKNAAATYKNNDWGWVWFEAVSQPDAEKQLNIGGFGYPAMVAVNQRKKKFVIFSGSFDKTGLHEFLRDLSLGRGGRLATLNNFPEFVNTTPWDGKDGQMHEEEEIDLADLGIKTEL